MMSVFEAIYIGNIVLMIVFTTSIAIMIGKMKYSLYSCIARLVFQKDATRIKWLWNHKHYILCYPAIAALIYLALGLLSQLDLGLYKVRAEDTLIRSCIVWFVLTFLLRYAHIQAHKCESK